MVAQGTVDGTTSSMTPRGTGRAQFDVDVPGGADGYCSIPGKRQDFGVEYIDTENVGGCGGAAGGGSSVPSR